MLVLDANIAAKFVLNEPGQSQTFARLESELVLIAPDWIQIELAHTMWKRVSAGSLTPEDATAGLAAIDEIFDHFVPIAKATSKAFELALALDHWVYDCLYLACALEADAPLLTADRKFWKAAKRAGYGSQVELLTWAGGPQ